MSFWSIIVLALVIHFVVKAINHNAARHTRSLENQFVQRTALREAGEFRCQREGCGAINPLGAAFCRRCGERAQGAAVNGDTAGTKGWR